MGQPGSVGAVIKEIQERELHPVGVFLGALHWLFCVVSVYDWLMSLVTKFTRTFGSGRGVGDAAAVGLLRYSAKEIVGPG